MSISTTPPQSNDNLRAELERDGKRHLMEMKAGIQGDLDAFRDEFLGEILQQAVSEADLSKLKEAYPDDKLFVLIAWQEDLLTRALMHDEGANVKAVNNGYLGMESELTNSQMQDWLNAEAQILSDQQQCNEAFAALIQNPSPSQLLEDTRQNCDDESIGNTLLTTPPYDIHQRFGGEFPEEVRALFQRKKKRKVALDEAIEQGRINRTWANGCMQLRLTQSF